jgi:hypothetical protein
MPSVTEGRLTFQFPDNWRASKLDEWSFYRNQFQRIPGTKSMDVIALAPAQEAWLIEIKDYRGRQRTRAINLADEVALKARDSLAAIAAAKVRANDTAERQFAGAALQCTSLRVVLHLEQPAKHSKLFPRAIDPAAVKQRLKQIIKAIDPHPLVLESARLNGVAWTVN